MSGTVGVERIFLTYLQFKKLKLIKKVKSGAPKFSILGIKREKKPELKKNKLLLRPFFNLLQKKNNLLEKTKGASLYLQNIKFKFKCLKL